jgi:hypothetical protein
MEPDFNWVTARSSCILSLVFEKIKLEVEHDVKTRNLLLPADADIKFRLLLNGNSFVVAVAGWEVGNYSVKFILSDGAIVVRDAQDKITLEATLTLNDEGECMLLVAGKEREFWQFRKEALDQLFFRSPFLK